MKDINFHMSIRDHHLQLSFTIFKIQTTLWTWCWLTDSWTNLWLFWKQLFPCRQSLGEYLQTLHLFLLSSTTNCFCTSSCYHCEKSQTKFCPEMFKQGNRLFTRPHPNLCQLEQSYFFSFLFICTGCLKSSNWVLAVRKDDGVSRSVRLSANPLSHIQSASQLVTASAMQPVI